MPLFRDAANHNQSQFILGLPRSSSPHSFDFQSAHVNANITPNSNPNSAVDSSIGSNTPVPSAVIPPSSSLSPYSAIGPSVKPLDYGALIGAPHASTHLALSQTLSDLSQWLGIIETGLGDLLRETEQDRIDEEEFEDSDEMAQ